MSNTLKITVREEDEMFFVKIYTSNSDIFSTAIDFLKSMIHKSDRRYDPEYKCWIIDYRDDLNVWLKELDNYFNLIVDFTLSAEAETANSQNPQLINAFNTLFLLPTAPIEVIKSSYKALARIWHPDLSDATESHSKMIEINRAYEIIMEVR